MNTFNKTGEASLDRLAIDILAGMDEAVVVADHAGRLLYCNSAAVRMFGPRSDIDDAVEWIGRSVCMSDTTPCSRGQIPLARALRGERVEATEFLLARPEVATGDVWISATAYPLRRDDRASGGVITIREITGARMAHRAKSRFLYRMSHELRACLTSILGFSQMLALEPLSAQQGHCRRHILRGGYRLLEFMSEVLDAAPLQAGELNISLEPVRIREALVNVLPLVQPLAHQFGITIEDVPACCDHHIRGDRQWLKQVLTDLLSSAIMVSDRNSSIIFSCRETQDNRLRLEIAYSSRDSASEQMDGALEASEDLSTHRGTPTAKGLGLSGSKRLVEAMGGTVGISHIGGESSVSVEFSLIEDPLERLDRDEAALLQLANAVPEGLHGTVLCIEDDPSNLRLIDDILSYHPGVRFLAAMRGQIGVDLAAAHVPDWILLDLHLPDMLGEEVLRRVLDNPVTRHIPVTILSGDATPERIRRLLNAGARDYMSKPLDVEKILILLESTVGNQNIVIHEIEKEVTPCK